MQPYNNNIVFKPFPPKEYSEAGLLIPESCRKVSNKGIIVAVGEGTEDKPMHLKEGMVGYRVKDWGTEIIYNNEQYFLMDAEAILAVE